MTRFFGGLLAALLALSLPASAKVQPFPPGMRVMDVPLDGVTLHVRVGGKGPAILMLHGFGDTGDMWAPLAKAMIAGHTLVIPDLRGMGLSSHPDTGYDKKTQGRDMAALLDKLEIEKVDLVTHDIGNMVGYAFAAQYPQRVARWVAMDAPLPGIGDWDKIAAGPKQWHFYFYGPDEERLVAGRERIYLDRFYDEISADPKAIDEQTRAHYAALYARPHAMHDAFEQFKAFPQDGVDDRVFAKTKLAMPILGIGADHSFGTGQADDLKLVASNVQTAVIANSGHWLMEEQPDSTVAVIHNFLDPPPERSSP